jgi:hypothetical protein
MVWPLDLLWHWNQKRKLIAALHKRKAIRKVESERVRQGKLAAQRERWAQDPLRGASHV